MRRQCIEMLGSAGIGKKFAYRFTEFCSEFALGPAGPRATGRPCCAAIGAALYPAAGRQDDLVGRGIQSGKTSMAGRAVCPGASPMLVKYFRRRLICRAGERYLTQ